MEEEKGKITALKISKIFSNETMKYMKRKRTNHKTGYIHF